MLGCDAFIMWLFWWLIQVFSCWNFYEVNCLLYDFLKRFTTSHFGNQVLSPHTRVLSLSLVCIVGSISLHIKVKVEVALLIYTIMKIISLHVAILYFSFFTPPEAMWGKKATFIQWGPYITVALQWASYWTCQADQIRSDAEVMEGTCIQRIQLKFRYLLLLTNWFTGLIIPSSESFFLNVLYKSIWNTFCL